MQNYYIILQSNFSKHAKRDLSSIFIYKPYTRFNFAKPFINGKRIIRCYKHYFNSYSHKSQENLTLLKRS